MNLDKFILEASDNIERNWQQDKKEFVYTKEEARVAAVLTRMDSGLTACIAGYIAKKVDGVSIAVWAIVVLLAVDIYFSHFA